MERKKRVIVYVDGFNFYYGLKKGRWRAYYWLDIVKLFDSFMRPDQELLQVKYFTARPLDLGKSNRQNDFLQANQTNSRFKLILGKYLKKNITCFRCQNVIHTYEEKESDVRITTQIVSDAYEDKFDIAVIVSADSDMVPAIELAMHCHKTVFVYFPPNQHSNELASIALSLVKMNKYEKRFKRSLLPSEVALPDGHVLRIPKKWKDYQDNPPK